MAEDGSYIRIHRGVFLIVATFAVGCLVLFVLNIAGCGGL